MKMYLYIIERGCVPLGKCIVEKYINLTDTYQLSYYTRKFTFFTQDDGLCNFLYGFFTSKLS